MSHISGLVAAGLVESPFEYCDMVTTTVHKTLRGPRSGILFYRKSTKQIPNLQEKVEKTIFPGLLGGPLNHTIAAMATCFKEAGSDQFKEYQEKVLENSKVLGEELERMGYKQQTGGTSNHMNMISIKEHGLFGDSMEHLLDGVGITVNKFQVVGTPFTSRPDGLRVGSPAMTTRGCGVDEFKEIARILNEVLDFGKRYCRNETLDEFKVRFENDLLGDRVSELSSLKRLVRDFSNQFEYNFSSEMI
jgi:glycine hydroxymethyltransferase